MAVIKEGAAGDRYKRDKKQPLHQTDEFRETVRRIKERENAPSSPVSAAPTEEKKAPTFNIPLPRNAGGGIPAARKHQQEQQREKVRTEVKDELYNYLDANPGMQIGTNVNEYIEYETDLRLKMQNDKTPHSSSVRHASRVKHRQDQAERDAQIAQIRLDVEKEVLPTVRRGTSKEDVEALIEQKVQERAERILATQPRYIFTADGTPFALDNLDERAQLEKSLIGESPVRRKWELLQYDIANTVGKTLEAVSSPERRLSEVLTDKTEKGNVIGAVAQLGLNTALLGVEYMRAGAYELFVTEERWKRLEAEAEAIKYTDPAAAQGLMQSAEHWKMRWEQKQEINQRISVAKKAVMASWEQLNDARDYQRENVPYLGSGSGPARETYFAKLREQEAAAQAQAADLRANAYGSFNTGNYEQAIDLIKQAQAKDREGELGDAYGAYTWIREPEREAAFLEDAALLELQKGEKLSDSEIRRLKEYHANAATEITASFIYDPLNFIPAAVIDDVLKVGGKGLKAAGQLPGIKQTVHVLGTPVRWMARQTVASSANKFSAGVHDVLDRIGGAYLTAEDTVMAVEETSVFVLRAKQAPNEQAARAIFDEARQKIPGLQNIPFGDFKKLMDASDHLNADNWSKLFNDALMKADDDMAEQARRLGVEPDVSEVARSRRALIELSTKFQGAVVDAHRIHKGSRFTDDTIAGWTIKTMRGMSGEQVNDMLELSGFDKWIVQYGETLGSTAKGFWKGADKLVEGFLGISATLGDFWKTVVLTTPRYLMGNLPDTAMRSAVYGGNIWDDLTTLFASTQRTLADDLGIVPQALTQSLARTDLDFAENVTSRLLYENWKPKTGLLSYIAYEYKRLAKTDQIMAKSKMLNSMLSPLPDGKLKNALGWLGDGLNSKASLGVLWKSLEGGIADFNTAIEFTYRIRMFHKEYFNLLHKLEPQFMEKGLAGLSPATKEIARQIWKASEGNPRRLASYAEALAGKSIKGTPAEWAFIVPPEIESITKGMSVTDRQLFISSVRSELETFIAAKTKAGEELTGEAFTKFFDDYVDNFRNEIQHRMSQSHSFRDIDDTIRKDGVTNDPLTMDDLQGAAPIPQADPRARAIEKATERLQKGKRASTGDIAKDYEVAVSKYADVQSVPGDQVTVVIDQGKPRINIGVDALSQRPAAFYDALHDATIQIFKHKDQDYILRSGFKNLDEYEQTFRQFMDDPAAVLAADERKFLTLANQLDQHPQLRTLIERTRDKAGKEINKIKYDSMLDYYREVGEYSDAYGFTRPPDQLLQDVADDVLAQPGYHVAAAQESSRLTAELARAEKALPPEIADKFADFRDRLQVYRQELKQIFAFTFPGPKMYKGAERSKRWEQFYQMATEEYLRESTIKTELIKLIETNPAQAEKIIDEALADFGNWFLEKNGIKLEWDADMQKIMHMRIIQNGRQKTIVNPKDLANVQKRMFTTDINKKLLEHPPYQLRKGRTSLRNQLKNALRETFDLPSNAHAEAWSKVIDNHAKKWSEVTGRPIEEYYDRLGFQRVEDGRGFATRANSRLLKGAAVERRDGNFFFYGLGQSNFESMVRATSELFWDDLNMMAEFSDEAAADFNQLREFIFEATGKPVRGNRLDQDQSNALADVFTAYIQEGAGPNIKIKNGLEQFKRWIVEIQNGVTGTPLADEIPGEVYSVMDRLFIESKINDVPKVARRKAKVIAKELGINFETDDDLLKIVNETLAPGSTLPDPIALTPEQTAQRATLEQNLLNRTQEHEGIMQRLSEADDVVRQQYMMAHGSDLRIAENEVLDAQKALDEFDAALPKKPEQAFKSLEEVPTEVLTQTLARGKESQIAKELNEGWEVWRSQRALAGFPDEALTSAETFKAYLKQRIGQEWSEVSNYYNRLLWEVEQFEDAMLSHHAGKDFAEMFFPRVPDVSISNGMKTFIRNQESMISNYESALKALDEWKKYMGDYVQNGHPAFVLPKDAQAELLAWSKGASDDKAEMLSTIINGSDEIEGAIDKVNKIMIDYQYSNYFDNLMKNFFPFWKFPSRSIPFWAETMITHPQLIAGYERIQRMSRSQRYQAGAVTSRGKPMPSLDGYIKIPGTDMWFNPIAPLSFRYLLDVARAKDDIIYAAQSDGEEMEPKAFLVKEMMETGQVYGFSLAPWMSWLLKGAAGIPDEVIPRFPLAPHIPLLPRWMAADLISKTNKIALPFGQNLGELGESALNMIYPEAPWHDYLVERYILEQTLSDIQSNPNLTDKQKMEMANKAASAIKYKNQDPMWQQAYKEVTSQEWVRSTSSFFTGFYPKEFGDTQAMLLGLRNERNQLKSALNNEFQATIFDVPTDADDAWAVYMDALDAPEGWVYRLYTDIGWVRDEQGDLVRNPEERAKYLAIKIKQDEDMSTYYDEMAKLSDWYNDTLKGLPVGATWDQRQAVYNRYAEKKEALAHLRAYEKFYGTNKPKELIERDIMSDWFRAIKATQPRWDAAKGETYDQYQLRVKEWEADLPNIAPLVMRAFRRQTELVGTLNALHADQQLDPNFFTELLTMTTPGGIEEWDKENDDVFDALNKAWKSMYWDQYWNGVIGKSGYEVDLAEQEFFANNPEAPGATQLVAWINTYYGPDKFSFEEIRQWVEDVDPMTIEDRRVEEADDPDRYKKTQDIWNMLSWLGPGGRNRDVFNDAYANAGGDPDWLTTWYDEAGNAYLAQPEKLDRLHETLGEAMKTLDLKPPTRGELIRFIQAQEENDKFNSLVRDELGDRFFDYMNEEGEPEFGTFSFYNNLTPQQKRKFRDENPDQYAVIEAYYDMKEVFAEEHATWADYYGLETTPTITLPEDREPDQGLMLTPPNPQGPPENVRAPKRERDPSLPPAPPPLLSGGGSGAPRKPTFSIPDRTGNSGFLSSNLYNLVGEKMAWEIREAKASGRPISSAGQSFLRSLASRYPNLQGEITQILSR